MLLDRRFPLRKKHAQTKEILSQIEKYGRHRKPSIGTAAFLIKLLFSRIAPVDIIKDCAKKFHAKMPEIRKSLYTPG
jgi:hypothetical protein